MVLLSLSMINNYYRGLNLNFAKHFTNRIFLIIDRLTIDKSRPDFNYETDEDLIDITKEIFAS